MNVSLNRTTGGASSTARLLFWSSQRAKVVLFHGGRDRLRSISSSASHIQRIGLLATIRFDSGANRLAQAASFATFASARARSGTPCSLQYCARNSLLSEAISTLDGH